MVYVTDSPTHEDPEKWIYDENHCRDCGTRWRLDRTDKEAPVWRWFLGVIPRPKASVVGPGIAHTAMYIVKHYPAETGISGTYLTTRCPECGTYYMRRKPSDWAAHFAGEDGNA